MTYRWYERLIKNDEHFMIGTQPFRTYDTLNFLLTPTMGCSIDRLFEGGLAANVKAHEMAMVYYGYKGNGGSPSAKNRYDLSRFVAFLQSREALRALCAS